MKPIRSAFIALVLLALVLCALIGCTHKQNAKDAVQALRAKAERLDKAVPDKSCKGSKYGCIPCEYTGNHLCIMSLDWLSSLGDNSTNSQHAPVWIHPGDDIYWIGASGEVSLNVRLDQMVEVNCDNEHQHIQSSIIPVGTFDYDSNLHRVEHAQANNPGANKHCFKNYIEYKNDPNSSETWYVDPHIYIGDGSALQ